MTINLVGMAILALIGQFMGDWTYKSVDKDDLAWQCPTVLDMIHGDTANPACGFIFAFFVIGAPIVSFMASPIL